MNTIKKYAISLELSKLEKQRLLNDYARGVLTPAISTLLDNVISQLKQTQNVDKLIGQSFDFKTGDVIKFSDDYTTRHVVQIDAHSNLFVSDYEKTDIPATVIGEFDILLSEGTMAEVNEVNQKEGQLQVLFSGEQIDIDGLNKKAYLGILNIPFAFIVKA